MVPLESEARWPTLSDETAKRVASGGAVGLRGPLRASWTFAKAVLQLEVLFVLRQVAGESAHDVLN